MGTNLDSELENAIKATDGEPEVEQPIVPAPPPKPRNKGNLALLGALLVMALGVVALFLVGFKEASIYEINADQVVADASKLEGRRLRVTGELVPGTLVKKEEGCEYRFRIQTNDVQLPVRFARCEIPDTFRDRPEGGVQVTVEGQLEKGGKTFEAATVMAKCASKYDPETHEMQSPDGSQMKSFSSANPGGYPAPKSTAPAGQARVPSN